MNTVCARCGKKIKGEAVMHVPPQSGILLGVDSVKSFHPACYKNEQTPTRDSLRARRNPRRAPSRAVVAAHARGVGKRKPRKNPANEWPTSVPGEIGYKGPKYRAPERNQLNYKLQHYDGKAWHTIGVAAIGAANLAALKKKAHYFIKMGMKNKMRIIKG
ncbi:MAG: hypothetical protein ACYDAK_12890 [Candidatus Limnocylindrales bacterium]